MYFKYDIKIGFKKNIISLFIIAIIVIVTGVAFYFQILDEKNAGLELPRELDSMDYFLHIFEGMRPLNQLSDNKFQLPITWFLIHMILFYFTGKYPYSELYNNHGANIIMKGGSRNRWFLSKWTWCVVAVIIYYLIAYISILIFCFIAKIPISFQIKPLEYQELLTPIFECSQIDTVKVIIQPVIASIAAISVQLVVSLITSPLIGFMFMAVIYISSAYYFTPFLIGNLTMLARNRLFYAEGIEFVQVEFVSIVIIIVSLMAGVLVFRKHDIMERK